MPEEDDSHRLRRSVARAARAPQSCRDRSDNLSQSASSCDGLSQADAAVRAPLWWPRVRPPHRPDRARPRWLHAARVFGGRVGLVDFDADG